jgi:two-component system, NarL family, sensor histidine kinase UhpB
VLLQLDRLQHNVDERHRDEVEDTREALRGTLEEVRGIAARLRPEALDDLGLNSALAALTNDVARRAGARVERSLAPVEPPLSPEEELVVYRVAQEALTNAVRHSGARCLWLTLAAENGAVELTVRDDGAGFDPEAAGGGAGLRGMRERAVLIDAQLDVHSTPGDGTIVRLRVR